VPAVLLVDPLALAYSLLSAALTALVARSRARTCTGSRASSASTCCSRCSPAARSWWPFAGALDLLFAGWELVGISSALFIGFFHERDEPVRSSVAAFATYRLCDAGLLIAIVMMHELLGSTRLSALPQAAGLPAAEATALALLFLLSAMGKSAQLPFSGWLPRAMEGPDAVERALLRRGVDPPRAVPDAARGAGDRRRAARRRRGRGDRGATAVRGVVAPGCTPTPRARWRTPRWRRWG
jgi:formate hydrogenlyase subunit 3/multisubunit Na+/H+ antiporter MnhD subunit